jgi:predicted cobalt transporter CbtA
VPDRPNTKRYWDGQSWTGESAPSISLTPHSAPTVTPETESAGTLVVAGYIMAVLIPLLGFILGIVATTRPAKATARQGPWILALSVAAFAIYLTLFRAAH